VRRDAAGFVAVTSTSRLSILAQSTTRGARRQSEYLRPWRRRWRSHKTWPTSNNRAPMPPREGRLGVPTLQPHPGSLESLPDVCPPSFTANGTVEASWPGRLLLSVVDCPVLDVAAASFGPSMLESLLGAKLASLGGGGSDVAPASCGASGADTSVT
jgi:hypothetical protein